MPIKDLKITSHSFAASYIHTFGLANKLARVQLSVPAVFMSGSAQINGRDTNATRNGLGDAKFRFGINLTGSPPLDKKDFTSYTQKTILGVSLVTSIPIGYYDKTKRINIGSNRWAFKPEVGVSRRFGMLYTEAYCGMWFFTKNNRFLSDKTLDQKPVFNIQGHGTYFFKNRMMASLNTVWFEGGEALVNEIPQGELLNNWRIGATWSVPVARGQLLRLQFHFGAFTTSGYDYNAVSLAYQYIF